MPAKPRKRPAAAFPRPRGAVPLNPTPEAASGAAGLDAKLRHGEAMLAVVKAAKAWADAERCPDCGGCEGTGSLAVHGVDGECGMCNGSGTSPESDALAEAVRALDRLERGDDD